MSLTSINATSPAGSFDLLATDSTEQTGLTNTSDKPITVSITAEGKWSLLKPDFATSDPSIIKYKTPVDGDGSVRDQNDEKFNFKYPKFNTAALVGKIKDAKGNLKSSVAGKKQTIELLPGESVSFTINDDPAYFKDNAGQLKIAYSIVPKSELSSETPANLLWAGVWAGGAIISVDGNKLTIDMSYHKRIPATGTINANDPTKATVTFHDASATFNAQLSDGKITWFLASNSALWGFWDRSKYWFA